MSRKTRAFYFLVFLVSISLLGYLVTKVQTEKTSQLNAILSANLVKVSITNSADTYYLKNSVATGFEYELASAFAKHLGVNIEFSLRQNLQQLSTDLKNRDSHISIAGRAIITNNLPQQRPSTSYTKQQSVVVYRVTQGIKAPTELADIVGRKLLVSANSLQNQQLEIEKLNYPELSWSLAETQTTYDMLQKVLDKDMDIAVISAIEFQSTGPYFPGLKVAFELHKAQNIHWLLANKTDDSLINAVNNFLSSESTIELIKTLEAKYYQNNNPLNLFDTLTFKKDFKNRLPKLEPFFKQASQETGIDWLLLAAIAYQESHWNEKAVSPTGVKGIMMLTKAAAKEVQVTDRIDPRQSIIGGAKYLIIVKNKIPTRIQDPDRTYLALAGYNTGFGHLEDARILAKRAGLNPDLWEDVNKTLPLLTKEKYFTTVKHGYARGYEPVNYVKNIKRYLQILKWEQQQQLLKEESGNDSDQLPAEEKGNKPADPDTTPPSTL
ncbi:hypothetical protein A9R01_16945 ['Osedax' symbiont bacterium Rs2_46_30_T18]|nr:hypothetical protein A9R01_16945 ['Osedax' symbiont bacterium Rs2_46_30_T18]